MIRDLVNRLVAAIIWRRVARHHLGRLYARRANLRRLATTSYTTRREVARALVQLEGEIATLEVKLRVPPYL